MIQDADDRDLKRQLMPTANEPIPEGGGTVTEKSELPSAPQHPEVLIGDAQMPFRWDPVPDALFYNFYF